MWSCAWKITFPPLVKCTLSVPQMSQSLPPSRSPLTVYDVCFLSRAVLPASAPVNAESAKSHLGKSYVLLFLLTKCLHFVLGVVHWEQSLLNVGGRYCVGERTTGARKLNNHNFFQPQSHMAWFPKPCRKQVLYWRC